MWNLWAYWRWMGLWTVTPGDIPRHFLPLVTGPQPMNFHLHIACLLLFGVDFNSRDSLSCSSFQLFHVTRIGLGWYLVSANTSTKSDAGTTIQMPPCQMSRVSFAAMGPTIMEGHHKVPWRHAAMLRSLYRCINPLIALPYIPSILVLHVYS